MLNYIPLSKKINLFSQETHKSGYSSPIKSFFDIYENNKTKPLKYYQYYHMKKKVGNGPKYYEHRHNSTQDVSGRFIEQ